MENKANEAKPNTLLRDARMAKGLTQQQVADLIGSDAKEVSRWELGLNVPNPHYKEKLCEVLEKKPEELGIIRSARTPNVPNQESIVEPEPTEKSFDDSNKEPFTPTEASEGLPSGDTHSTLPQAVSSEIHSQHSTINHRPRGRRGRAILITVIIVVLVLGVIARIALPPLFQLFQRQQTPPTFQDFSGTSHSAQWTINGNTIVSDGSASCCNQSDIALISPNRPPTNDYAVGAQIQETGVNLNQPQKFYFFGFLIRGSKIGPIGYKGYFVEIVGSTNQAETATVLAVNPPNEKPIKSGPVDSLGAASHTYRVEVQGSRIRFTIDKTTWLDVTDPTFLSGTTVGLVDSGCILQVHNFTVS